jgi:bifunctional DNA-binding transcriptional regulator/antitoxin component of YhaV-PrlF toxin-antitoxin module
MRGPKFENVVVMEETAITVRGYRRRTTIPSGIFKFLGLKHGDVIRWTAVNDGTVFVTVKPTGSKSRVKRRMDAFPRPH